MRLNATILELGKTLIKQKRNKEKHFIHKAISLTMAQNLTPEDFAGIAEILQRILSNDNEQRKAAEAQLNVAKSE